MPGTRPASLVVGSVQLGLAYGAANRVGKPGLEAALSLVRNAADAGVKEFDTARAYGDSEERLGEALVGRDGVRTITKLSPLADLADDAPMDAVRAAVDASVEASLAALRSLRLDCLLLHRAGHVTAFGGAVWQRLMEHQRDGRLATLGVSVQSPDEALAALRIPDIRHIQLPFNLLDGRWHDAGVVAALKERGDVTVHARSVFLQGILAAEDPSVWPMLPDVDAPRLLRWIKETSLVFGRESAADLCLAFARGQDWIDGVVVGMETQEQLADNLRLCALAPISPEDCEIIAQTRPRVPADLLNPAKWPSA